VVGYRVDAVVKTPQDPRQC